MASFGKIILFRTEDLSLEEGNAFQPILNFGNLASDVDPDLVGTLKPIPFNIQTNLDNSTTAKQNYRILGKNYRISKDGALTSERYGEFNGFGAKRKNLVLGLEKKEFQNQENIPNNADALGFLVVKYPQLTDNPNFIDIIDSVGKKYKVQGNQAFNESSSPFINHNLEISKPLVSNDTVSDESKNLQKYGIGDSLKIMSIYNYYLKDYEQFYNNLSQRVDFDVNYAEEKSIPNFYYLISLLASPEKYASLTANSHNAPFSIEGFLEGIIPPLNGDLTKSPLGSTLSREIIQEEQSNIRERNSVVVVTPSFYKRLSNEIKTQKAAHPFYNEISIPVQQGGTVFRDLFKKAKIYEQLQYRAGLQIKIINEAVTNGLNVEDITSRYDMFYTRVKDSKDGLKVEYRDSKQPYSKQPDTGVPYNLPLAFRDRHPRIIEFDVEINENGNNINFKNLPNDGLIEFENYVASNSNISTVEGSFIGGKVNGSGVNFNLSKDGVATVNNVQGVNTPLTFFANDLESENEYIGSVIQNKANSILNFIFNKAKLNVFSVFENNKNYSEILFFEVQKIAVEDESLIQTFILPNDPDIGNTITYIDSQIKYGKEYIYKIYAHTISIGNKIKRGDPAIQTDGPLTQIEDNFFFDTQKVTFLYENDYDIKIIRAPYHNTGDFILNSEKIKTTTNIDRPPISPQVTFYPFKNVSDKIGFWFNIGLGTLKMKPTFDLHDSKSDSQETYKKLSKNQLTNGDITKQDFDSSNLLFGTDDFGGKIKIYRITNRPKTYSDFQENKIADVDVVGPRTLIDDIIPNQDYYYTFVHIDVHGLESNPTPVYHLKMITSDAARESSSVRIGVEGLQPILFNELIYLDENSYDEQKVEKSFKKYLLLEPALSQTYLSFDNFETGGVDSQFDDASDVKDNQDNLLIGKGGDGFERVGGKKFKIRLTSKQTGRKIDLNVDFKKLSVIENYKE